MSTNDIPLDKAELLSLILEALLYGFSLFMFGGTIWVLSSRRSSRRVNYKILAAACSLLLLSTAHIVIDIIRIMEGFIALPEGYPGGRIKYFSNVSSWTFVTRNYLYAAQTLIGDGVVLYRCYAVWQSKLVIIVPVLLWLAVGITGFGCPFNESRLTDSGVFDGTLARWITSFWTSTLMTNIVTTILLAYRIWYVENRVSKLCDRRRSELRPLLLVIIDAGAVYSLTLLSALVCYVKQSNGQFVVVGMITPIISITFYMVIIRVGLANRANQPTHPAIGHTSSAHSLPSAAERRSRVHIEIDAVSLNGAKLSDNGQPLSPLSRFSVDNKRRSEIKFEDIMEEEV